MTGAAEYEVQYRVSGAGDTWESVATTTAVALTFAPEGGTECGTVYDFRARSYGDASTYAVGWGSGFATTTVTTEACDPTG